MTDGVTKCKVWTETMSEMSDISLSSVYFFFDIVTMAVAAPVTTAVTMDVEVAVGVALLARVSGSVTFEM